MSLIEINREDRINFELATHCKMCDKELTLIFPKFWDRRHLTCKFSAAFCGSWNLQRQEQKFVTVFVHGSSNYILLYVNHDVILKISH